MPVPREDFTLNVSAVEGANQPLVTLNLKGGLQPGVIYELIYEAQDPVLGRLLATAIDQWVACTAELVGRLAADTGCVVLLKGPATIVADPDGRVLVATTGDRKSVV